MDQYWSFDIAMRGFGVEKGQSFEEVREFLQGKFAQVRSDEKKLLELIRVINPEYTITRQDEEQRQARRALSERARENLYQLLYIHKNTDNLVENKVEGQHLTRGIELLLDFSGTPEAEASNKEILEPFWVDGDDKPLGGSQEERTELMKRTIDRAMEYDFRSLYSISDEELAERFPKIFNLYLLMAEGGDAMIRENGKLFDLPEDYVDKLRFLKKNHQTLFTSLKVRFEFIANPNYEIFHSERIYETEAGMLNLVPDGMSEELNSLIENDPGVSRFAGCIDDQISFGHEAHVDRIKQFAEQAGMDLNDIRFANMQGEELDAKKGSLSRALGEGQFVKVTQAGTDKELLVCMDGNVVRKMEPGQIRQYAAQNADSLLNGLDNADPWAIRTFTGSKEFANMKKAMGATKELMDGMPQLLDVDRRRQLEDSVNKLAETSRQYLETKQPLTGQTKESERLRIKAARDVLNYANGLKGMLAEQNHLTEQKRLAHEIGQARNAEAYNARIDAERQLVAPLSALQEYEQVSPEQCRAYVKNYYGKIGSEQQKDGKDILRKLASDIYRTIDAKFVSKDGTKEFNLLDAETMDDLNNSERMTLGRRAPKNKGENEAKKATTAKEMQDQLLAKIVTFSLLVREGIQAGKDGATPLRDAYRNKPSDFVKTIAQTQTLQRLSGNMTPNTFRVFVATATGARQIEERGKNVSSEYSLDAVVNQILQEVQQVQANKMPKEPINENELKNENKIENKNENENKIENNNAGGPQMAP